MRRLIALFLLLTGCGPSEEPDKPLLKKHPAPPEFVSNARVRTVYDGDTVQLEDGRKVRYIGIDTPEREMPYYGEARELNRSLVENRPVRLEMDVEPKDKYGRTLAYIFVQGKDGREVFVNGEILRLGLAYVYTHPPNVKHTESFVKLQREARLNGRGFWSESVDKEKEYFGSRKSKVFHRPSCDSVSQIGKRNKVRYAGRDEAFDKGKAPCRSCRP